MWVCDCHFASKDTGETILQGVHSPTPKGEEENEGKTETLEKQKTSLHPDQSDSNFRIQLAEVLPIGFRSVMTFMKLFEG